MRLIDELLVRCTNYEIGESVPSHFTLRICRKCSTGVPRDEMQTLLYLVNRKNVREMPRNAEIVARESRLFRLLTHSSDHPRNSHVRKY